MRKAEFPVVKDIVLLGGGHAHVSVLRNFGMFPIKGARITLISPEVDTPYSGMLPGLIAVALFGFTLSYDEFPRTLLTAGVRNTLPLEIWPMTPNVTSPALYALGTVTTVVSFIVIALSLGSIALIQRRRRSRIRRGGK